MNNIPDSGNVSFEDRKNTLKSVSNKKCQDAPLCMVTAHKGNKSIMEHLDKIEQDGIGKEICKSPPIVAFRRNRKMKKK